MKFNIKNYPNFKSSIYEKDDDEKRKNGLYFNQNINEKLLLPEIITELNNSNLLNIKSKEEIPIIFENFNWLRKTKTNINNFIKKTIGQEVFEHSIAHYKPNTKTIHIFNRIFNPTIKNEQFQLSYSNLLNSVSNSNFIVNLFVLHEIGHAIYNNILEDKSYNTNYGNLTDYFKIYSTNQLHKEHNTILHENFADMFAAIAYLNIDKNNSDIIKDLEIFRHFRKELEEIKYYTFNNLDKIINDCKSSKLNLSNNEQLLDYINLNTNNEIKIRLKKNLETTLNSQQHNKHLAYLSHLFKLEDKSFTGIVSYLEKEINYVKPLGVSYEIEFFQDNRLNSEMNKVAQRIKSFSINFKESKTNQYNRPKI